MPHPPPTRLPSRWMRAGLPAVLAATLLFLAAATGPGLSVLDRRAADYLEDGATGRVVAGVGATLLAAPEGVRLRVVVSAAGPFVDAVPGYEGVRGANRIAARELGNLLREGRITVDVRGPWGKAVAGRVLPGRRGRLPERVMRPDGSLEPRHSAELQLELILDVAWTGDGTRQVVVCVDEVPRLTADVEVTGRRGRITGIDCLSAHGPGAR